MPKHPCEIAFELVTVDSLVVAEQELHRGEEGGTTLQVSIVPFASELFLLNLCIGFVVFLEYHSDPSPIDTVLNLSNCRSNMANYDPYQHGCICRSDMRCTYASKPHLFGSTQLGFHFQPNSDLIHFYSEEQYEMNGSEDRSVCKHHRLKLHIESSWWFRRHRLCSRFWGRQSNFSPSFQLP